MLNFLSEAGHHREVYLARSRITDQKTRATPVYMNTFQSEHVAKACKQFLESKGIASTLSTSGGERGSILRFDSTNVSSNVMSEFEAFVYKILSDRQDTLSAFKAKIDAMSDEALEEAWSSQIGYQPDELEVLRTALRSRVQRTVPALPPICPKCLMVANNCRCEWGWI